MGSEPAESEAVSVADGVYLSTSPLLLRRLIETAPPRTRVLTGYAGWGPGQLDAELAASAWLISDVDASIVFETPAATMWEQAIRRLGADPGKLHSGHGVALSARCAAASMRACWRCCAIWSLTRGTRTRPCWRPCEGTARRRRPRALGPAPPRPDRRPVLGARHPGAPFVHDDEARPSESFDALVDRYAGTQAQEEAWLEAATEDDLARVLENALIPGGSCSVAQALVQACMHAHGHRAQCAKLLRRHGGVPPPSDFILWLPAACDWAGGQPSRQHLRRIDPRRAPRRQPAGEQADGGEHDGGDRRSSPDRAARARRAACARPARARRWRRGRARRRSPTSRATRPSTKRSRGGAPGAEREADPDLAPALVDAVRRDAVEPDRREDQRQRAEEPRQQRDRRGPR